MSSYLFFLLAFLCQICLSSHFVLKVCATALWNPGALSYSHVERSKTTSKEERSPCLPSISTKRRTPKPSDMKRVGNHEPVGKLSVGQVTVIISSFHELDTILLWFMGH